MADIELVIKLNEDIYKQIKGVCGYTIMGGGRGSGRTAFLSIPLNAIRKGIPLPKGHGRLIDADAFRLYCFRKNWDRRLSAGGLATINMYLDNNAPTIIEADKESEET